MGASIREVLAESLLGSSKPLDWDMVSQQLARIIKHKSQAARIADHRERQEFYMDGGHPHIDELIEIVIQDRTVKDLRKEWIGAAGFNNVTRRIINAMSTVYQDPAVREVDGKQQNDKYQLAIKAFRQDERARQWNRLANLHRTLLIGVRVRNIGSQKVPVLQPRLDIITPAQILALITSPRDPSRIEGVVLELSGSISGGPHSVLWTNHEIGYLDKEGNLLENPKPHGFDRMPFVLLRLDEDTDSMWSTFGRSLVSAHKAEWFCDVCLLKETKSATKQAILAGDLTHVARNQASDTESALEVPDGVSHQIADMSMDLSMFRDTANHIVDTIASSFGIAPSILRHEGVQSAEARDLMRVPLRELRLEQHSPLRDFERELAEVQAMVLRRDMPELEFDTKGWRIDFADPQTPKSGKEQLEEFEHARRLRLTSTVRNVMDRNPDLNRNQAEKLIGQNIEDELWFHIQQRPFFALTGAMHGGNPATPAAKGDEGDDGPNGRNEVTPTQMGEEA